MQYRREIDGLRAIAVLPVILFHAGFEVFSGGFIGVDVFFVISGYLITSIILQQQDQGTFSIAEFYIRRARRILPALFVVMLSCIPFAWVWMLPSQFDDFSQSIIAVVVFASNILFWKQSDYFEAASEEKPLLHTWSLAVEEQYYLVFPLFILIFWRAGKQNLVYIIALVTIVSFAMAEYASRFHPNANFYLTPTRAWELLAGSLAAFALHQRVIKSNSFLAGLGLVLIFISIFAFDSSLRWPSIYTIVPVLGTALIILYTSKNSFVYTFLSTRVLVGVGLISYSAYLWHQPLFAFAKIKSVGEPSVWLMLMLAAISILLAYFTWRYIEAPFRDRVKLNAKKFAALGTATVTTLLLVGVFGYATNGKEEIWLANITPKTKQTYLLLNANANNPRDVNECIFHVFTLSSEVRAKLRQCKSKFGKGIAILGDSHSVDLFGAISSSQSQSNFLVGISSGGCRPHTPRSYCHYEDFSQALHEDQLFHTVIYEQAGFYLLRDEQNKIESSRLIFERYNYEEDIPELKPHEEYISLVADYLTTLSKDARIIWLGPRVEHHIPRRVMLRLGCDYPYDLRKGTFPAFETLDKNIDRQIQRFYKDKITYLSQVKAYAFNPLSDILTCKASYWSDGDHWSKVGEKKFGALIVRSLSGIDVII